jgi:DNA-directed RNA polymerase subunit RPC12/RpoP
MKRLFWPLVALGLLLVAFDVLEPRYVVAPLMGLTIWRIGTASFASLRAGGAHIPDGPPEPVDVRTERTTYYCTGCGAEWLLLVRGAEVPPRHCGERTVERREVASERR